MKLSTKLLLAFASLGILAIILAGWKGFSHARQSTEVASLEKLMAISETKKQQVESYFRQLRNEAVTFSENPMVIDALVEFKEAFNLLQPNDKRMLFQSMHDEKLTRYYEKNFLNRLKKEEKIARGAASFLPFQEQGRFLQFAYLANNPNSKRENLTNADTGTVYDAVHERYHSSIRRLQERFGLSDIFLVDHKTGSIIYSVGKAVDFATSLTAGPYQDTTLAAVFREAASSNKKGFVKLVDFAPYTPAYNAPATFLATPVFQGTKKVGVLILQVPVNEVDAIMTGGNNWEAEGLGKSGETYLVGTDYLMRSNSRFLLENPKGYFESLREVDEEESAIFRQRFHKSTILLRKVESGAVKSALAGRSGSEVLHDYWSRPVLSAYSPLQIDGIHWAIIAEIDMEEALESLGDFKMDLLGYLFMLLLLLGAFTLFLSRTLSAPLEKFMSKTTSLQRGNFSERIRVVNSKDEFGKLALHFNELAESLQKTTISKNYFDGIINSMNDALLVVSFSCDYPEKCEECDAVIKKANNKAISLFGYSPQELVGQSLSLIMKNPTEDYVFSRGGIHELFHEKTISDREIFCITKSGESIPILFSASALHHNGDERDTEVICIIHDITRLFEAKEENRMLAKFPDENPNPILRITREGELLYANRSSIPLLSAWQIDVGGKLPPELLKEVQQSVGSKSRPEIKHSLGILSYSFTVMPVRDGEEIFVYGSDITEKKKIEEKVLLSEQSLKEAQKIAHIGNWTWDIPSGDLFWSDEIYRIFGHKPQEFKPSYEAFLQTIHPEDQDHVQNAVNLAVQGKKDYDLTHRIVLPEGSEKIVHEQGEVFFDEKKTALRMVGTVQDVTQAKVAEEKLLQSAKVFEGSKEAIVITTTDGKIVDINNAYTEITGYARDEVINKNPRMLKSGKHDNRFYKKMWGSLLKKGEWQGEIWDRRKDGEIYPKWLSITSVKDEQGKTTHYVGIFTDLTQLKQSEERIQHLTNYDILTGLPNKVLFRERLERLIEKFQYKKDCLAVLFIDLDNFKTINDSLGIQAGDELLIKVAKRLQACVTEEDTVARFSADDFAIILSDTNVEQIPLLAQWAIDTIADPFHVGGEEIFITMSIGISVYPNDGNDVETLLKNAISAMNFSRKTGTSAYNFFSKKMNTGAGERLKLAAELRHAITREEFVLHYQPRINLKTGKISGMEALIRWNHPEYGLVPPYKFIPLAEETELIVPMTEWIFRTAFKQTRAWHKAGFKNLKVGINLSPVHFERPDLVDNFVLAMQATGLDPKYIDLELTESMIMHDVDATIRKLHDLKNLGCELAIDDFGTGYSSLAYLKRFPIDILKIDQAFIRELTPSSYDAAIAKTIIVLSHSLKLKVIAEGVETREHLNFLKKEGCDEIQGFFFSKPLPVDEFTKLLKTHKTLKAPTRRKRGSHK